MTAKQKKILLSLLNGGFIAGSAYRIILFDRRRIPLLRLHKKTFDLIRKYLKKQNNLFVISIAQVRRQRKNNWIKAAYLQRLRERKNDKERNNIIDNS